MPSSPAPPRAGSERIKIFMNVAMVITLLAAPLLPVAITAQWTPVSSGLAVLALLYFIAMGAYTIVMIRSAIRGDATISDDVIAPVVEDFAGQVLAHPDPTATATAVTVLALPPAPWAGHLWTTITIQPELQDGQQTDLVRIRRTNGWALSRKTAYAIGSRIASPRSMRTLPRSRLIEALANQSGEHAVASLRIQAPLN